MLLFGMYPRLYPENYTDYPKSSTPPGTGKTFNEVLSSVSAAHLADSHPALWHGMFCFYCNTTEDHTTKQCQNRALQEPCQLCGSVNGYHNQAKRHLTDRCVFGFFHSVPEASLLINRPENLQLDDTGYKTDYAFIEAEWDKVKNKKKQDKRTGQII
jgi:hypothetical protein